MSISKPLEYMENAIEELYEGVRRKSFRRVKVGLDKLKISSDWLKSRLPEEILHSTLKNFNRHLHYIEHFLEKKDIDWIRSNLDDIRNREMPDIRLAILSVKDKGRSVHAFVSSRNVFIVHGHDIQSLEELKEIVRKLGLETIVLHEKASRGLTLAEKLERYSENIGFAFVILTPDDVGCQKRDVSEWRIDIDVSLPRTKMLLQETLKSRARQNVIFEMGYFWGLLKRKRVCCLLKGDVEKPSDIEGIVYIPFKESVNECHSKIVKELKAAGYELRT